jgi:hypothetical protein
MRDVASFSFLVRRTESHNEHRRAFPDIERDLETAWEVESRAGRIVRARKKEGNAYWNSDG